MGLLPTALQIEGGEWQYKDCVYCSEQSHGNCAPAAAAAAGLQLTTLVLTGRQTVTPASIQQHNWLHHKFKLSEQSRRSIS